MQTILTNEPYAIRLVEIYDKDEDYFLSLFELIEQPGKPLGFFDSLSKARQAMDGLCRAADNK